MNKTKIPWTERTWNPMHGCDKYSAGCAHCYAETMAKRLKGMGVKSYENGFAVTLNPAALDEPKKVKKPTMFFVCSMGDIFHDDVPFEYIDKVMDVIEACPQHTFQLLTKRANRMYYYFVIKRGRIPGNAWLGVTVETSDAKPRIEVLEHIVLAPVRFLSCEPLLSDLGNVVMHNIDWVICGGESGNQARPMQKEWVLNLQRQCKEQGVPFFFKQWGTWGEQGKKSFAKNNEIDGVVYQEWPKCWKGGVK